MRLAVIGVGLIGGSFALALKQAGKVSHVVGVGRNRANLDLARERRIIDAIAPDAATAARDADVVLVAAPVAQSVAIFGALASILKPGAVVTDAGSTKRDVVAAARAALGTKLGLDFIPSHGNFLTLRVGKAAEIFKRLLRRGVIVRPVGGAYQLPDHLRVTIGTAQENDKFLAALAASLKE